MPWSHRDTLGWSRERLAPRKYVDMVWRTDGRLGNWDPPKKIQPGDYGTLSRDTGEFNKEGSIFDDDFQQRNPDLVIAAPVEHHPDQERLLCSRGVTAVDVGGNSQLPSVASDHDLSVKYKFSFTSRQAFALLMIKPVITQLRQDAQLRRLVGLKPDMDGKVLVTEITSCPAYALILSEGIESEAVISFQASASAPGTSTVGFGGGMAAKWTVSSCSGQWRYGSSDRMEPNAFYPLFTLRSLSEHPSSSLAPRFRSNISSSREGEDLNLFVPPWEQLDEDGEEIEPEEDF